MSGARCVLFVCAVFLGTVFLANTLDISSILEIIPPEERLDFLKYYAKLGEDIVKENGRVPNSQELTEMTHQQQFAIQLMAYAKLREVICFEDGHCVDIGDSGIHPFI